MMIDGTKIELTDSSLTVLLHLMVAHRMGGIVHKSDLGAREEQGFKGISILRNEIKPGLGLHSDIIENDYHGNYNLSADVTIGECATDKLLKIGDARISALARRLQNHPSKKQKKSEGNS